MEKIKGNKVDGKLDELFSLIPPETKMISAIDRKVKTAFEWQKEYEEKCDASDCTLGISYENYGKVAKYRIYCEYGGLFGEVL
jgi:hypothetical protein